MTAPIALFTYLRPDHTRRTVNALLGNALALDSDLIVYSDAARTPEKQAVVDEVRAYLRTITGFRSVVIHHRPHKFGLARSIIEGVTEVLQDHERVIVLEDDMETSPHFLTYMNEALERLADDDRVASIHGYVYPVKRALPEAFFLPGADCWGWATWRRAWALFNPDGQYLLDELKRRKLIDAFNFNGAYSYSEMLEGQIKGSNDSWAVRWYASAFLAGKVTLYPGRSLVHNIGNDDSGTHCGETARFDGDLVKAPIDLGSITVEVSQEGLLAFEEYFRYGQSRRHRIVRNVFSTKIMGMRLLKSFAKDWLPPAIFRWTRNRLIGGGISFEGEYATWDEAAAKCSGYDAEHILAKVLDATLKVKRGEAAFERDSVLFDEIEYSWPVLAGLMWAAARNGGVLNVLDFGGALGSSYFQNRKFLQALPEVRWNVVEQQHYVQAGQKHIQDERLRFYKTIGECLIENKPNVVLLSSVMQYLESPFELIAELSMVGAVRLIIDRTPFSSNGKDKLVIQKVPSAIYSASYPMWIFSLPEFKQRLAKDWSLVASNTSPEGYVQTKECFEFAFQGMMLESRR